MAGDAPAPVLAPTAAVIVLLVGQAAVIRRRLTRRTNQVLAGGNQPRSLAHLGYIAAEVARSWH